MSGREILYYPLERERKHVVSTRHSATGGRSNNANASTRGGCVSTWGAFGREERGRACPRVYLQRKIWRISVHSFFGLRICTVPSGSVSLLISFLIVLVSAQGTSGPSRLASLAGVKSTMV